MNSTKTRVCYYMSDLDTSTIYKLGGMDSVLILDLLAMPDNSLYMLVSLDGLTMSLYKVTGYDKTHLLDYNTGSSLVTIAAA